ncbi:MAG: hypothetical protein ABI317_17080 [Gaiellales bacterium]
MDLPNGPLVSTDWLAAHLGDPALVVLDATVQLDAPQRADLPYEVRSGRADWLRAHIPTSRFADIPGELSDPAVRYPFTLPVPERFADAICAVVSAATCAEVIAAN